MRRALCIVCSLMLLATPAAARSGNDLIKACHGVLENQKPDAAEAFGQGVCMGTVATVMQLGPHALNSICPPPNATNYQAVRVVVKFMDDTPERLDGEFVGIAIAALQKAWPCTR
jgi:Rap1a immunity proteins